jgi:pimeloyl-ACP methyl ester carboxylesterase
MAARFALRHPERVSRLALIVSGGYYDQDWDNIQSLVTVSDLAGVDRLYKALFVRVPWVMRASRSAFLAAYTSAAVKNALATLSEDDVLRDEDLARIRVPTAVVWAEHDGLFNLKAGRAMAAALPRSHFEVLPDCGHAAHMESPRALVEALQKFRRATASAAGATTNAIPTLAGRRV